MTTAEEVKEEVKKLVNTMADVYEKVQWVTCPVCKEEWTKLMEVFFFKKEGDRWRRCEAYVCPPCGRSVRSVQWFADKFCIFLQDGNVELLDSFKNIGFPDDVDTSFAFKLILPNATLIPKGSGIEVHQPGKDKEFFPNIAVAMSYLAYGKKDTTKVEATTWGGKLVLTLLASSVYLYKITS